MNIRISPLEDSSRLGEVFALYRKSSATLGNMPRGGFVEGQAKGTLLGAFDRDGRLVGYILYRISRRTACIAHVCVANDARGRGISFLMLDYLKQTTSHLDGIKLKCRNDFEAHSLWPKAGFISRGRAIGRGADAAEMTVWHYGHGQADLFTSLDSEKPKVIIDANVFFDLSWPERPHKRISEALTIPWVEEMVELCITPEIFNDISRSDDFGIKQVSRTRATAFHEIQASGIKVDDIAARLKRLYPVGTILSARDESDVRHMAFTIAAGEKYFVTRDKRLLNLAPEILQNHELQILAPAELISHLDVIQREQEYLPRRLGVTTVQAKKLEAKDAASTTDVFRHPQESIREFRALLDAALAEPKSRTTRLVSDTTGQNSVLLCCHQSGESQTEITLLRIADTSMAATLLRNELMEAIITTVKSGLGCIRISDPRLSTAVLAALEELGFTPTNDCWIKPVLTGFQNRTAIAAALESYGLLPQPLETREDIDSLGTIIWPGKLDCDSTTCYLVPIDACWAEHFFDTDLADSRLPGLSGIREDLHLGVEGVYYSATKISICAPGHILWYVSKGREGVGSMQVKAMSRLREVATGTPKTLFRRFNRLGVYGWKDVVGAAKGNLDAKLTALRFSHTELFQVPLPGNRLDEFEVPPPYGPRVIPFATFRQIYSHAFPNIL